MVYIPHTILYVNILWFTLQREVGFVKTIGLIIHLLQKLHALFSLLVYYSILEHKGCIFTIIIITTSFTESDQPTKPVSTCGQHKHIEPQNRILITWSTVLSLYTHKYCKFTVPDGKWECKECKSENVV